MDEVKVLETLSILTPVIMALVQVVKGLNIPSKFSPIFAIIFGVVGAGLFLGDFSGLAVWVGILSGLSASGLYSGAKKTLA